MKISGYGEFQQMRKAAQKDDAQLKETADKNEELQESSSDAVSISPEARRKGKLRMASDYRQDKVADIKARMAAGTLVNDESLKSGMRKMLGSMLSGDL